MKMTQMTTEVKKDGKWAITYWTDDESIIYPRLSGVLISVLVIALDRTFDPPPDDG